MSNHYNLKVIQYPNGSVQIRSYSTPVKCKQRDNPYEDSSCFDDYVLDPFTFHKVKDFDDIVESSLESKLSNQFRSANRTKQKVFTYARAGIWEWFVTLTFNKETTNRYDYDECSKKARKWMNNQRIRYAPDLHYILVPEPHKDGAWHFHGLLSNIGSMVFSDSGRVSGTSIIYNMPKWKYGFTTASKVQSVDRVSKYIGKYITKSLCDLTVGRHRYFVSNNLQLPDISTMLIDTDERYDIIERISNSLGKKIAHVSQTCADDGTYTKVMYYELL